MVFIMEPQHRPRAIIFDFGGVVVQWDPRRVYRKFLETEEEIDAFFREVGFQNWNADQDRGGRTWADAVEQLASQFPHRRELISAYHEFWEDSIAGPIDDTVRILERLRAAGYRLVGLSNWSAEKFKLTRQRYQLFNLFDEIIVSGEVGTMKPEREIFEIALRKIGLRADECLFIDDSPKNVEAAAALGFQTIQFKNSRELEDDLRNLRVL
ncbi:MAG TPA: HAD family phosphatase [Thermoanaerobaculia bacterium]|nr:HAD family phosphatase [Thermoanaerobaculia bacterium]